MTQKNNPTLLILVAAFSALTTFLLIRAFSPAQFEPTELAAESEHAEGEAERGPHGGRLLEDGAFAVELQIIESGIPPEFHIYAYDNGAPVAPDQFSATVELGRLGGIRDTFSFVPESDYLRGVGVVLEPHSFDVYVSADYAGESRQWHYESYEGRTDIPERIAIESGLATEAAGPQQIVEVVDLTGAVQANPARVSEVRARFSGIVTEVLRDTGDYVERGETLGLVETNESLRSVPVIAPISGLIVNRNIQVGQVTGNEPLFVVADLSEVWVQLDVFGRDLDRIETGQQAVISSMDGSEFNGLISWVSPLVAHGSQSVRARIPLENRDSALRVGQFVRARVIVTQSEVPLAVLRSALQTFRDFDVVYAKVGETYEVRMLQLGLRDDNFIEVLGGLAPGEVYVTSNSYLVKADIEKSGASHDH
jgi:cobalt-zinc-cadmium efflux system membrane fusion protein